MKTSKVILAAAGLALLAGGAARAGDVRVMWYSDGVEGVVFKDLMARFAKANPGINVVVDEVPYSVIKEQLPVQLASGNGPDIARVTDIKTLAPYWLDLTPYLKDPEFWRKNYGDQADWMREDNSNAITGFMSQITLTGGFANKTLFDQAGVALPGPKATWDEWVEAAKKVQAKQKTPFAFAIDRSGHRVAGPSISYGAKFIAADGSPNKVDAGMKAFLGKFVQWNKEGAHEKDVWVSASGTTYRPAADDFINALIPFYYSGSWQVSNFETKIGDAFDWVATGNPCGPNACTGVPGGAALVAVKTTKNPKDVAAVMDYLASTPIAKEFAERTLFLPANKEVIAGKIDFQTKSQTVKDVLNVYVKDSALTAPEALKLPAWKWGGVYYSAIVARIGQVVAGELQLDDAYNRIDSDMADKVKGAN
jgi:alpha-1,4-digalacturonate transport system substrate-binding protein